MAASMVEVVENAVSNQKGRDGNPRPGDFTFDACLHCISPTALVWVSVRTAFRFSCRSRTGSRWRRCIGDNNEESYNENAEKNPEHRVVHHVVDHGCTFLAW